MATKEDILEQLVEEYLLHEGYFVQHNVKFLPRRDHPDFESHLDSNHSDIDVIGFHPMKTGVDKVVAVSCKSWQEGFNPTSEIKHIRENKKIRGREAWKSFRELVVPKWSEAFVTAIEAATGSKQFTYITAVTKVVGDKSDWENCQDFQLGIGGNPIRVVDLRHILNSIYPAMGTTLASTEVGRMLQLFKAAGISI